MYEDLYSQEEGPVYIPIEDIVMDDQAKGTVTLDSIEEKVTLNVEGLFKEEGYAYEAWLIDKDINLELSAGKFDVDEEGKAELVIDISKEDILDTDAIVVTKEPVPDEDESLGDVLLQGLITDTADVMTIKLDTQKEMPEEVIEEPVEEVEEMPEEEIEETPEEEVIEEPVEEVEEMPEEEVIEEEAQPETKATVLIVTETEEVKLQPKASDPDKDKLAYTYTSPLNQDGIWKTSYGDEGEYTVTVTVSDGELSSSKDVLVIVNKKEESPVIESSSPDSKTLTATEDSELDFTVTATDLNGDKLSYNWKLDGDGVSTTENYIYQIGYDSAGSHTVKLIVSDGTLTTENIWSVSVENVNRNPELNKIEDFTVKEGETVTISPEADDPDKDALSYKISEPVGDDGVWETTHDDAGEYTLDIEVSDGVDTDSISVKVTVENVNRPPVIEDIVLG